MFVNCNLTQQDGLKLTNKAPYGRSLPFAFPACYVLLAIYLHDVRIFRFLPLDYPRATQQHASG
jgi:hypothetical protein